jgi:Mg2+ and Co2+ transporter CorA
MSQELANLQTLHKEVIAFKSSKVYALFMESTQTDLSVIEERILDDELTGDKDLYNLLNLRGQRMVLKSNLSLFEDAIGTLANRIEQMILDEEQPTPIQQETKE